MATIVILVAVAAIYGYSQNYATDKLIGIMFAGALAGFALFGAQVVLVSQPKVPCWSEMKGGAQFFRAMPFMCQRARN
ncbi:hypothetical protein A2851_01505 [Candidatus Kaiserbacteria bacterium RIFCSPHIGHO2_01_FULL_53_29]|uniref:Uncharacterized protein n=1 Tax=Candidatus Kaiserbacteria bacterium RIFCSPHIGHO2_01_FULL_53_29 TaxID=1798480 RepID=A0A1F6CUJ5_9BACT|nr:MAG: hypothetical protein A2851_01505 [Candidatus Kaiserbacteria bacterium RIFCSPHIGHO2_01_FULL_53_29]